MRTPRHLFAAAVLSTLTAAACHAQTALNGAFTYQGELASTGTPATGTFDIRFRLFDAPTGGNQIGSTLCSDNLAVASGRFAASLDFGAAAFNGQKRFLEIEVRADAAQDCTDSSGFTLLAPRQELTASPSASFAATAGTAATATNALSLGGQPSTFFTNSANLTGTLPAAVLPTNVARTDANQTFTGQLTLSNPANTFAGNGAGLTNLSGGSISAGTLARSSLSADVQSGIGTVVPDLSLAGQVATGNSPRSVAVSGSLAYVVSGGLNSLQVFNISNPTAPTLAGSVGTGTAPTSVVVSGSFAYVVNQSSNTLQVFNISNPATPALAGSVGTGNRPLSVAVSGSLAYVVNRDSNTLQVFNISNPAAPTFAGSVATDNRPNSVAVSGSLAYVVNIDANTLQVFNISNPAAPTLAGRVATERGPRDIAVSGSFAYVACLVESTLQVFDISNPSAPTLAGSVPTISPLSVEVSGSLAYVANFGPNTLQLFNISNPAAPTLAGSVATDLAPISVAVSGSFAYLVNESSSTLQVFKALGVGFGTPLAASSLAGANGSGLTGVNATQLSGRNAAFYTNASNITAGTLAAAQVPNLDASKITTGTLADARLSSNIPLKNAANAFTSTGVTSFAGNLGIGTTTPSTQFALEAVSIADTQIALTGGPAAGGAIPPRTWSIQSSNVTAPQSPLTGSFQIVDRTATASRLLIDTNGNVGIGTTNPSARLSVAGNVTVNGVLAKAGGSFKIDHPLDPENKYLYHSFVESPDMMNIYNGNVTTDDQGYATITLPDYFEALNRDFRYQLTIIDTANFALARISREISDGSFEIATNLPGIKVSWQVTGIRQDAWAQKNRIPNSVDKPASEKGKLLHPEAFGKPATQGIYTVPAPAPDSALK